jgi:RNA methyltransferase, TrmH family
MLSKNRIRELQSLHQKKVRKNDNRFFAEGRKIVTELVHSDYPIEQLYATSDFINQFDSTALNRIAEVQEISEDELQRISNLQQAQDALAICTIPSPKTCEINPTGLYLFLDSIRDPGNLGTLIRLSEWFGLDGVLLSEDCVEWTNPKVIQATMGSFIRVQPIQVEADFWDHIPPGTSIISADLEGDNLYTSNYQTSGILIISSESHGLSGYLEEKITQKVHIPALKSGAESLNAAIAASIVLSEFTRRRHWK